MSRLEELNKIKTDVSMELTEKERAIIEKYFNMEELTEEEEVILEEVKSNLLFYVYG